MQESLAVHMYSSNIAEFSGWKTMGMVDHQLSIGGPTIV